MFSACWVAQDYSHRTPGRAQSCQERPRNIIFRPNRWRRRAPPPPHHQITSRARRTTSSAPYSPVPFLRSDSVLRLQGSKPPATSSFPSLSLSLSRGLASACLLATPPVPFEGGAKPGGRGRGWPPRTAAAAATRRGRSGRAAGVERRTCGGSWLRRSGGGPPVPVLRLPVSYAASSLCFFFLRPCCSDLCRRMSRRSPFVDWTFVLRDYAPSLLIQCNSPLIFVVDIFFFASILCSIHCAVPKFLRSDIKLRYC